MKKNLTSPRFAALLTVLTILPFSSFAAKPFHTSELIFPLEAKHNHSSAIVETPNGSLFVCWFNGSGERQADDVKVEGARLKKGDTKWSDRFTIADTPGFPDTNATIFIDPRQRLWLMYPTILANEWYTALMKYKISSNYEKDGPPVWEFNDVLPIKPGPEFAVEANKALDGFAAEISSLPAEQRDRATKWIAENKQHANDKFFSRLGWMTRAHPFVLDGKRLIVPLYSDGYSFSMMAITDDWGQTWKTSTPLVGRGNIQPSIARLKDGTLLTYMRDNGPPPKRLMMSKSHDRGDTWDPVVDTDIPNPGSGAEVISLSNGYLALIYNDLETGRNSLAVSLSDDEGKTWKWTRHLEKVPADGGEFHYPSIIQARDGSLHASYSYFINNDPVVMDKEKNRPVRSKSIKHAHFNIEWVQAGDDK